MNPHDICTWNDQADCADCPDRDVLACKWDRGLLIGFFFLFLPFGIASWLGMALVAKVSGAWWYLVAYGAFLLVFFGVFETRVLCCHCPFYGEDTRILHCLANHGFIKIWRYRPEPLNRIEKTSLLLCFGFLGGFPIFAQAYGIWFMVLNYESFSQAALLGMIWITVVSLFTAITFFFALNIYVCPKCINFSCPLNRVQKSEVDEYLSRNPVIREAWEKRGYTIDLTA